MNRILVVDDERQITRLLRASLQASGYEVVTAADGNEALERLSADKPDLIITDLSMPVMDGVELTKRVRQTTEIPIVVLSVRDGEGMKVKALDEGADDYITKPFSMPELLARVRAHLRRVPHEDTTGRIETGDFVVDQEAHTATLRGVPVPLTPKEFDLLVLLAQKPERVLTHRVLLRGVWGHGSTDQIENLRVLVASLRKKLERGRGLRYIESEPWIGYRFMPAGVPMPERGEEPLRTS
jgi:two-component system, OmpR family, KDP operon response regulator KdpE